MLVRMVLARWRLFLSLLVFLVLAIAVLLRHGWQWSPDFLIAWDFSVVLYLSLVFWLAGRADTVLIRRLSEMQDVGRFAIPGATVVAALASLVAVLYELSPPPAGECVPSRELALGALTILLSWALIHTILAIHYAHEFYGEHGDGGRGLRFPGGTHPNYWDFLYFAFVIGMTSQVSDVQVTSRAIRKTVMAHSVVSFVFNVAVLALSINIVGSALGQRCERSTAIKPESRTNGARFSRSSHGTLHQLVKDPIPPPNLSQALQAVGRVDSAPTFAPARRHCAKLAFDCEGSAAEPSGSWWRST
jgi:uncharacterized membrane protein